LALASVAAQQGALGQQSVEMDPPIIVDITNLQAAQPAPEPAAPPIEVPEPAAGPAPSSPPTSEPEPVRQEMCPALKQGLVIGEPLAPISQGRCGDASPVLVTAIKVSRREVPLAMPITVTCPMATAFADWVNALDAQSQALADTPLATVTTGGSMVCRGRVGTRSRGLSEHAFANAIDVHGFILADGRNVDVLSDWRPSDALEGQLLRLAHALGCERFTTILGPEANAAHRNHFHFDLKARTSVICR
jgi:hypothetical protein